MDEKATSSPFDEALATKTVYREAMDARHAMPRWMHFDDLIAAGWLGYLEGWERKPVHQFAKRYARYYIIHELRRFWGNRTDRASRGLFKFEQFDDRDYAHMGPMTVADERHQPFAERRADENAMDAMVAELVLMLDPPLAQVLWLRYVESMTYRQIAERLGIKHTTAYQRGRTGIIRLRYIIVGKDWRRSVRPLSAPKNRQPANSRSTAQPNRSRLPRQAVVQSRPESTAQFAARMRALHAYRDEQWAAGHPATARAS